MVKTKKNSIILLIIMIFLMFSVVSRILYPTEKSYAVFTPLNLNFKVNEETQGTITTLIDTSGPG